MAVTWLGTAREALGVRPVLVDVRDDLGAAALAFVVDGSGRRRVEEERGGAWIVADRLERPRVDVLVCPPTAVGARTAIRAFSSGRTGAAVCIDRPLDVIAALDALDRGLSVVPTRLMALARLVPVLTDRQERVLGGVMAGQSNAEMARVLQVGSVTVKREVASLFGAFGAARRVDLIALAFELGFAARAVRP